MCENKPPFAWDDVQMCGLHVDNVFLLNLAKRNHGMNKKCVNNALLALENLCIWFRYANQQFCFILRQLPCNGVPPILFSSTLSAFNPKAEMQSDFCILSCSLSCHSACCAFCDVHCHLSPWIRVVLMLPSPNDDCEMTLRWQWSHHLAG